MIAIPAIFLTYFYFSDWPMIIGGKANNDTLTLLPTILLMLIFGFVSIMLTGKWLDKRILNDTNPSYKICSLTLCISLLAFLLPTLNFGMMLNSIVISLVLALLMAREIKKKAEKSS